MRCDLMIDQNTGELEMTYIRHEALARAQKDYGSYEVPPSYVCSELLKLKDRALVLRAIWRRDHGLPDDTVTTMVQVPDWGSSGDSFSAH